MLLYLYSLIYVLHLTLLINMYFKWTGLSGAVLNWLRTYLNGRQYFISLYDHVWKVVPQGSVLGLLLFFLYMLPLGKSIAEHRVSSHSYSDDTQLYIFVALEDPSAVNKIVSCVTSIISEILLIGKETQREMVLNCLRYLALQTKTVEKCRCNTVFCAYFQSTH